MGSARLVAALRRAGARLRPRRHVSMLLVGIAAGASLLVGVAAPASAFVAPAPPLPVAPIAAESVAGSLSVPVVDVAAVGIGSFVGTGSLIGLVWHWIDADGADNVLCGQDSNVVFQFIYGANCTAQVPHAGTANSDQTRTYDYTAYIGYSTCVSVYCYVIKPGAGGTLCVAIFTHSGYSWNGNPDIVSGRYSDGSLGGSNTSYSPATCNDSTGVPSGGSAVDAIQIAVTKGSAYLTGIFSIGQQQFGSAGWIPTATVPDPARALTTTATFANGQTTTCTTALFHESAGSMPAPCSPPINVGSPLTHVGISETAPGSPGTATKTIGGADPTPQYQGLASTYPDCATLSCSVQVKIGTQLCTVGDAACLDWQSNPDADCVYGPAPSPAEYTLDLSSCTVLAHYYDPQHYFGTSPYSDPTTGQSVNSDTSTDQDLMNSPATDPGADGKTQGCFPSGWDIVNPVQWVLQPVQCAIRWAFSPDQTKLNQQVNALKDAAAASAVGAIGGTVAAWHFLAPPDGCEGITIPWSTMIGPQLPDWHVLEACPGDPLAPVAQWSWIGIAIATAIGTLIACSRAIAGIVQFGGISGDGD